MSIAAHAARRTPPACRTPQDLLAGASWLVLLAWLISASLLASCGPAHDATGWRRLWPEQQGRVHRGMTWIVGVRADGRRVVGPAGDRPGLLLRADLFNDGAGPATIRLEGPGVSLDWTLAPEQVVPVEVPLGNGSYLFRASLGAVLGSPRVGRPLPRPRTLVCILVDTLRADHVRPELMPGVVEAFATGRRWRSAMANAPWTLPSTASFFTARPVLDLTAPSGDLIGVPAGLPTWPEQLAGAGFATAAVVANYSVQTLNGYGAGFETFLVPDGHGSALHPDAGWVVAHARSWLEARRGEDRCLYLHLMDPHEPYRSHAEPHAEAPPLDPLAHRERLATLAEATLLRRLYAGEVRHVDRALSPLLDELPRDAVVALTADHGEALGEHGSWGHGLDLYQSALAVPLMLRAPGVEAGDEVRPAQLMDLGPTLLGLVGVEPDPGMAGRSLLEGGSRPIVSATFGSGPLRWAWRREQLKITLRTAPQPGLGTPARSRMEEAVPLPPGAFVVDLEQDPGEDRPRHLDGELALETARVLADTAGRMVPGLQVWLWGRRPATTLEVEVPGSVEVVQAWSPAAMRAEHRDGRLIVSCISAEPVCLLACRVEPRPEELRALPGAAGWRNLRSGAGIAPGQLAPDPAALDGAQLWWNPERPRITGGHEETLERLRALGYIQ
jgi:arylsulfatase A-like enzyme